jgi:AcrR family transcriptional regulator
MPNQAFFNLSESKRNSIISVAIDEFSSATYDSASINKICNVSNIAKGSFYQYFSDKLDLYVYIMSFAIEKKISFFASVLDQFKTLTLRDQIQLLFIKGIEFAKANPQYAALGEQFSSENNLTVKLAVIKNGDKQSESLFDQLIELAKSKGEISANIDTSALNLVLQSLNKSVNEYMMNKFNSISHKHYDEDTKKMVESLLDIIFHGIEK